MLAPSTSEGDLTWRQGLYGRQVKMRSLRAPYSSVTSVLELARGHSDNGAQRENTTKMWKERPRCQSPPAVGGEARNRPPRGLRGHYPCQAPTSDSWPPERGHRPLVLKPPRLGCVQQPRRRLDSSLMRAVFSSVTCKEAHILLGTVQLAKISVKTGHQEPQARRPLATCSA